MTDTLQIILIIGILLFFATVLSLLKKNKLSLRYSLLWLGTGLLFLILAIFPAILEWLRRLLGFASGMNALYVLGIGFLIILLLFLTALATEQSSRSKRLIQTVALLEKRVRELEEKIHDAE